MSQFMRRGMLWGRSGLVIALLMLCMGQTVRLHAQDTPGVNDPPDITLPATPTTAPVTSVAIPGITVSDPDVGGGNMELEINISDVDGVGGRSVIAGNYGTFSWSFGTNVTSDVIVTTRNAINAALTTFTYNPPAGFSGTARIAFEIDDQGNTGTGGVLSRTRFINITVCATGDTNCATNAQPDVTLPSGLTTTLNTPISFNVAVSDLDVGAGNMEMEVDLSDLDGVGGLSVSAGDYGTFTWGFGSAVTSDTAVTTLTNMNNGMVNFTYTPKTGFTGLARITFEIDDQGNSQTALGPNVLSRTRFINIQVVNPATLAISLTVQGRRVAPDFTYIFPVQVLIKTTGGTTLYDNTVVSNSNGIITINNLVPGAVNIWVKGDHTLAVLHNRTLNAGANALITSLLREGDASDDNVVTVADFSIMAATFGKSSGQVGFDVRADFNEDTVITVSDFSLLAANFGQSGAAAP